MSKDDRKDLKSSSEKIGSGSTKEKKDKPEKQEKDFGTFNQLDPRFQLSPSDDPENIFPEEYDMIKEMRAQRPELERESDKFLVTFLCARRHDVGETIKLLDKYMKKRKELGLDEGIPSLQDDALRKHLESAVIILPKRGYDKHDRMISYIYISKNKKDTPIDILYTYGFWETQYLILTHPLKYLRNGCILVVDFKGFGLSNVDLSSRGIEYSKALSGMFPKRIRKAYLINGGWLLKVISEAARLLLSKKLVGRMEVGNVEGLKNYIDDEHLPVDYGGKSTFGAKDMVLEGRAVEERQEEAKKVKQVTDDMKNVAVSSTTATN